LHISPADFPRDILEWRLRGEIFVANELTDEYNRQALVRHLLASSLSDLTPDVPIYIDFAIELSDSVIDEVAVEIAHRIDSCSDETLSIIARPRYLDLQKQQKNLVNIDSLLLDTRISIGLLARECIQLSDQSTALFSDETRRTIGVLGHVLLLRCWLDDFGSANWDDPGENPFVQLDNHWIRLLPRAIGGHSEICICGFDFADPTKRELDPEYLQEVRDRENDPIAFGLNQVLEGLYRSIEDDAAIETDLEIIPVGCSISPQTVLDYSRPRLLQLLRANVDLDIPIFLERFSELASEKIPGFEEQFSSIEEIEKFFEYSPYAFECLASKTFLRLSDVTELDPVTRGVCMELGHRLLWWVYGLAGSGYGYGIEVVDPDRHRPNDDQPRCTCGFPVDSVF
jgi:hypothetical protein